MGILDKMNIKIYADGADYDSIMDLYKNPLIKGFTTNPTLMKKAGVTDYKSFAINLIRAIPDRPISFEVFADDLHTMEQQAKIISSWGRNVNVKIPVTNSLGEFTGPIIKSLSDLGISLNITAVFTPEQVKNIKKYLNPNSHSIISIFAGRIADAGVDPTEIMVQSLAIVKDRPKTEIIWASPRELLNVVQADQLGCHIITITHDILSKLHLLGKDLDLFSLDTVKMFYQDAQSAGFTIDL